MRRSLLVLAVFVFVLFSAAPSSAKTRPLLISENFLESVNEGLAMAHVDFRMMRHQAQVHRRWRRDSAIEGEYVMACEEHAATTNLIFTGRHHDLAKTSVAELKKEGFRLVSFKEARGIVAKEVQGPDDKEGLRYRIWSRVALGLAYEPCQGTTLPIVRQHVLLSLWLNNSDDRRILMKSAVTEKRFKKLAR